MGERPRSMVGAFALVMALACGSASAQQQPAGGVDYAGAMRQGTDLYEQGNKLGAIQIWEQLVASLGEERAWKVLYNLGLAYESTGDPTRAIERLDAFVRLSGKQQGQQPRELEERRQDAMDRLRAIRSTHGAIRVVPPPNGAVVLVRSGNAAADPKPAGFIVYLAPGDHSFEIYSGTANARRVSVNSVAGMTTELVVPNPPGLSNITTSDGPPKPEAPPATTKTSDGSFPTGWLLVGGGLTAASAMLPLLLGIRTSTKREEAEALGVTNPQYPAALSDFREARTTYYYSYIMPAALAVATTVIVILAYSASTPTPTKKKTVEGIRWSGVVHF